MYKHTNQLIHETSLYLLQHAHNPVNWYAWSDEMLKKAQEENKPILVSIGYSACHWCHVMEKESFEDEAIAEIMNENFINIKIDREERPDLDHIYMDAVQAMSGSGGWPLNVFLTPSGKPFYGGTYFPPKRAFNRPSWQEILNSVSNAFKEKRHEIDAQAENLTEHLNQSNAFGLEQIHEAEKVFEKQNCDEIFLNIMKSADKKRGGFGKAPKFPQTLSIQFLLRYYYINDANEKGQEALKQALLSLDKMIEGGIYDQIGGGFARYSTDEEWLAPHFEKMLYDNALLVSILSEAYQLTQHERYKEVINETMEFVQRELLHSENGFYAALDADSEGEEGKFYVWDFNEVKEILENDSSIFFEYYDITPSGNWSEGNTIPKKNILRVKNSVKDISLQKNIPEDLLKQELKKGREKLFDYRNKRIHPLTDDKIILGWNALMDTACSKAFAATGIEKYRQLAIANMEFLLAKFNINGSSEFYHTWKNDKAKYPAFLDDYAFLIQALIHLQEITADTKWLMVAKSIAEFVIQNFVEPETGLFFYTKKAQQDVIIRKKEVYDGALPSGNSTMAYNLYLLSILFDKKEWKEQAIDMVSSLAKAIVRYPVSFGNWAVLFQEIVTSTHEIVVTGNDLLEIRNELLQQYIPHRVLMISATSASNFPLLVEKPITDPPSIWLCKNFECKLPVYSVKDLTYLINRAKKG